MVAHTSGLSLEYEVGDSVFIDNKEWIIAEIINGLIKLLRESIDGSSQTIDVSKSELQNFVQESQHTFEN